MQPAVMPKDIGMAINHPTTADQRAVLRVAGYTHVSNLAVYHGNTRCESRIGHNLNPRDLGRFGSNNSTNAIITLGGEIWLAASHGHDSPQRQRAEVMARGQLCPNGDGAFVPCSNGEQPRWWDFMARTGNPDCPPSS